MDGTIVLIVAASANSVALGVVVFAVRKIVNTAINGIGKRLDTEREDRIKIDNELWSAVNRVSCQ
jgi:hypothetical protein